MKKFALTVNEEQLKCLNHLVRHTVTCENPDQITADRLVGILVLIENAAEIDKVQS